MYQESQDDGIFDFTGLDDIAPLIIPGMEEVRALQTQLATLTQTVVDLRTENNQLSNALQAAKNEARTAKISTRADTQYQNQINQLNERIKQLEQENTTLKRNHPIQSRHTNIMATHGWNAIATQQNNPAIVQPILQTNNNPLLPSFGSLFAAALPMQPNNRPALLRFDLNFPQETNNNNVNTQSEHSLKRPAATSNENNKKFK